MIIMQLVFTDTDINFTKTASVKIPRVHWKPDTFDAVIASLTDAIESDLKEGQKRGVLPEILQKGVS